MPGDNIVGLWWLAQVVQDGKQLINQRLQAMVDSMVEVRTFLIVDGA